MFNKKANLGSVVFASTVNKKTNKEINEQVNKKQTNKQTNKRRLDCLVSLLTGLFSGVKGTATSSNNTSEVEKVLGIEAARFEECYRYIPAVGSSISSGGGGRGGLIREVEG